MDVVLLDVICPQLAEISPDVEGVAELIAELNDFRFQLHHINRKLDRLLDLGLSLPGAPPAGALNMALTAMMTGISVKTLAPLEQSARRTLLPRLNARVSLLETRRPWWWFLRWWWW
jgi:hypothetical protein